MTTTLEKRVVRLESARGPRHGGLSELTTDDLLELERAVCVAIIDFPQSSLEDRTEAQSTIEDIDRQRDGREKLTGSRYIEAAPDDARIARAVTNFLQSDERQYP